MNPHIIRHIILPAWQRFRQQDSLQLLPNLEKTQWLSRSELLDLQWDRVGKLLRHAYDQVPYYGEVMRSAGADPVSMLADRSLEKLPLLERATITQQLERLRATNISAERFVPNGTGGSTGEPLRFFDDRDGAGWSEAAVWRAQRWFGVDVGDRTAYFWGANFDLTEFQGVSGRVKSSVLNFLMLPAWELSESTAPLFWGQMVRFKPRLLVAYAGALYRWARLLGSERAAIPSLAAIVVSAEMLDDEMRRVIEGCFKAPVYNRYGGRDLKFVAQECPLRKGLHINSENVLVEIVKDGRQARPGEVGEVIITRLDNFAMPFIRYKTGDLGVIADSFCDCGRSLPLLEKIEGRVHDAIVTADGRVISGPFFAHMMKDCSDVKEFQVHQLALNQLSILIVLQPGRQFVSGSRIQRIAQEFMGRDMNIGFELTDGIPLTRSGKRRVMISHVDTNGAHQPGMSSIRESQDQA